MTKSNFLRNVVAIAICLAATTSAYAQVGGALNRARNAAEQTVKSAGEQAKQSAEDVKQSANEAAGQQPTSGQPATQQAAQPAAAQPAAQQQALKPSAAAIAADPKASDNTKTTAFTLTLAERRARYEQLPDNVYLKPYYHPDLQNYYYTDGKEELNQYFIMAYLIHEAHQKRMLAVRNVLESREANKNSFFMRHLSPSFSFRSFIADAIPAGNQKVFPNLTGESKGWVPYSFFTVYSGFALFAADPEGFYPFQKLCEALLALASLELMYWDDDGGTNENRVPLADGGYGKLSVGDWYKAKTILTDEGKRLYDIAMTETPVEMIKSATVMYYNLMSGFQEKKNYGMLAYHYHIFETALYFWNYHPKRVPDETLDYLVKEYHRYRGLYEKEWKPRALANAKPIEMPQTYNMGAELEKTALAKAKSEFAGEFNVDKVVFTSDKWIEFKSSEWPYPVTSRTINVGLLTKDGDKWLIRFIVLQQMSDRKGGWTQNYGISVPLGGSPNPQPVNYK